MEIHNTFLPDDMEATTLKDVLVGETVYTVPWAMYADYMGCLWLNGEYSFTYKESGTSHMKITKTSTGFSVDKSSCKDYKYSKKDDPGFVGEFAPIAVVELS